MRRVGEWASGRVGEWELGDEGGRWGLYSDRQRQYC